MPRPTRHDSAVLRTLERHRAALLQEARAQQALGQALLAKAETACAVAEGHLAAALSAQRTLGERAAPVAAHDLQQTHQYVRSQVAALSILRAAQDRRRGDLAAAQEELSARLKDLKSIERLRGRLQRAAAKWELRRDQSRLDGLGIVKGGTEEAIWR